MAPKHVGVPMPSMPTGGSLHPEPASLGGRQCACAGNNPGNLVAAGSSVAVLASCSIPNVRQRVQPRRHSRAA